jgi:general secretion pathway protein G
MIRTLIQRRRRMASARGMTLLEIMIVIAILGLIASVVVVGVMNSFDRARINATRLKVGQVLQALDMYRANEGDYPSQADGLRVVANPPNGGPSYFKDKNVPKDEWGQEFLYFFPGRNGGGAPEVISKGPDRNEGTDDDIRAGDKGKE